jgi:hypothetical protein
MGVAERAPVHDSTSSPVDKGIVELEPRQPQYHWDLRTLDEHKLHRLTVVPRHTPVDKSSIVGNPAYRASIQGSNVQETGEGLSGDAQLRHQGGIHETLVSPRVNENPERFRLVAPQQDDMKRGASKGRPTRVLIPTDEPGLFKGQVDTMTGSSAIQIALGGMSA